MPDDEHAQPTNTETIPTHARILPTSTASLAESKLRHAQDGRSKQSERTVDDTHPILDASSVPRDFGHIIQTSREFDNDPDAARAWLIAFGNLKPSTDVSQDLKATTVDTRGSIEASLTRYQSLLPLLTQWMKLAYDRAVSARREQKQSGNRTNSQREQAYLDWLCKYVQDYLGLGHAGLAPQELAQLSTCMLDICDITSEVRDIEKALDVIYTVLVYWPYPVAVLDQTLQVLCKVQVYFNRHALPEHLLDCAWLLAMGDLQSEVVDKLLMLGKLSPMNTEAVRLRVARGALLLLRPLLRLKARDHSYLLAFDRVVSTLRVAAEARFITLCTDVIGVCNDLLDEEERLPDTLSHDWTVLMEVLETSAQSFICDDSATGGKGIYTPSNGEKAASPVVDQKSQHNHQELIRHINKTLTQQLHETIETKSKMVYEYLLKYPSNLTPTQCMLVLDYADLRRLCWPQNRLWRTEVNRIVAAFITNTGFTPEVRIHAIHLIRNVGGLQNGGELEIALAEGDGDVHTTKAFSFDILLSQVKAERDPEVFQHLAVTMEELATTEDRQLRVAQHFRYMIMTVESGEETSEDRTHVLTRIVMSIFLQSLHQMGEVASATFDTLVEIASPRCTSPKARVSAMILLFRLRCDTDGFVYVQNESQSEYIAAALCRTAEAAEAFGIDYSAGQRGATSSASLSTTLKSAPPLWMYPHLESLPRTVEYSSRSTTVRGWSSQGEEKTPGLDVGLWLLNLIQCLQSDTEWETYSYIVVHLGAQLSNTDFFVGSLSTIVKLRQVLSEQIGNASFREPPIQTGLKKSDVAICIFNILTPLIAYATMRSESIQKGFGDDLVRSFLSGVGGQWEGTSRGCIHALSICSLELPGSVASAYPAIVDKMSKNMTQPHLTTHILEFLAQVSRLPQLHSNFRGEEITMIFGICIQFLEKTREQQNPTTTAPPLRLGTPARQSGISSKRPPYRAAMVQDVGLPQYASTLAYYTMIFWFLSLKLEIRANYVSWIIPRLVWKNSKGEEVVDEQSEVFMDMMQRAAFSDLGETMPDPSFAKESDGPVSSASWIVGLSVVTVEVAGHTGVCQMTKRQASGTTYAMYRQLTADLPSHHAPSGTEIRSGEENLYSTQVLPQHILLQRVTSAAPTRLADQPIPLPKEDFVKRALAVFDRIPTVDSHKVGILYIGPSQTTESQFLSNITGSQAYLQFLSGLGTTVSLRPPLRFNPQGLRYPQDGENTIAWRDRVSEIVYHVPTMMPTNLEDDPQCIAKKAHVGNCHVNVIFNDSGIAWDFENFKSQFNYVNIVITPTNRPAVPPSDSPMNKSTAPRRTAAFYLVQLLTREGIPKISPASDPKVISSSQLPLFIRLAAVNANLFSQSWKAKDSGDKEFPSSWRARLQELKRLKERVLAKREAGGAGGAATPAMAVPGSGPAPRSRTPVPLVPPGSRGGERDRDPVGQGFDTDGQLAMQLDFSKWTL